MPLAPAVTVWQSTRPAAELLFLPLRMWDSHSVRAMSRQIDYNGQAVQRLVHAVQHQEDRRVVFLTGSGMSVPVIPSTSDLVEQMATRLGSVGSELLASVSSDPPAEQYQFLADEFGQRLGDVEFAKLIRESVLTACDHENVSSISEDAWKVPPQQSALARVVASLRPERAGPIFTTNFDPLTEVALRREHVSVTTISLPGSNGIRLDNIYGSIPVVHLHGFWERGAALSTAQQLTLSRPMVESMLTQQLANAVVIVMGYGGWRDVFIESLLSMAADGRLASLETEILWIAHGGPESVSRNPLLEEIVGTPALRFYFNVDAQRVLAEVANQLKPLQGEVGTHFFGWEPVPRRRAIDDLDVAQLIAFAQGAQPNWETAKHLPRLSNANSLYNSCSRVGGIDGRGDAVLAALGPTGEGKSLALRQAALQIHDVGDSSAAYFRLPSAGPITPDFIQSVRNANPLTFLFVDEADLVVSDILLSAQSAPDSGRIVWVLAMHSHYEHRLSGSVDRLGDQLDVLHFDSLSDADALDVASAWKNLSILPAEFDHYSAGEIASLVLESSHGATGRSLFGAVLHLWAGEGLFDRLADLMVRLEKVRLRGLSLADLLLSIAICQQAWDAEGDNDEGMSTDVLARICGIQSADVLQIVLTPLGREVGLARVGDLIFVRHPDIASAIVELATPEQRVRACFQTGKAGGVLREASRIQASYRAAYNLWQRLSGEEARAAARGATYGARSLLETRVSYMAACRRIGDPGASSRLADAIEAHGFPYSDRTYAERGFWVERALSQAVLERRELGVSMALYSLTDLGGMPMSLDQLRYGLVNVAKLARSIGSRSGLPGKALEGAALDLLKIVRGGEDSYVAVRKRVRPQGSVTALMYEFSTASRAFCRDIAPPGEWNFKRLQECVARHRTEGR